MRVRTIDSVTAMFSVRVRVSVRVKAADKTMIGRKARVWVGAVGRLVVLQLSILKSAWRSRLQNTRGKAAMAFEELKGREGT